MNHGPVGCGKKKEEKDGTKLTRDALRVDRFHFDGFSKGGWGGQEEEEGEMRSRGGRGGN